MISLLISFMLVAGLSTDDGVRCYEAKFSRIQAREQGHNLGYILMFIEDVRQIKRNEYNPEGDLAVRFRDRPELWGAGFSCEAENCRSFVDERSGFRIIRIKDELIEIDVDHFRVLLDIDRQRDINITGGGHVLMRSVDLDTCSDLPFYITYLEDFRN